MHDLSRLLINAQRAFQYRWNISKQQYQSLFKFLRENYIFQFVIEIYCNEN